MTKEQKSIDSENIVIPGIECFVKCISNKVDVVKDDIRSICLNFDIQVDDNLVGKENNLNINNLTPAEYESLCRAFGITEINDKTPFCATLMTASTKARSEEWNTRMARKEAKTDPSQTDILNGNAMKGATDEEIAEEKEKTEKFNEHIRKTEKKQKAEKAKSKKPRK